MSRIIILAAAFCSFTGAAAQGTNTEHARKTLEIYERIIEVESSKNLGNVPEVANYLANELIAAGFPKEDIEVLPVDGTAALIARDRLAARAASLAHLAAARDRASSIQYLFIYSQLSRISKADVPVPLVIFGVRSTRITLFAIGRHQGLWDIRITGIPYE